MPITPRSLILDLLSTVRRGAVPVRALATAGGDLKPLKEPWTAPADYRWIIIAAAIVILAAGAAYFLWKRRKKRVVVKEPVPELPADFVALRELRRIENLKLLEAGEFKQYYTLITDAIRNYIEKRFGVDALDRTTNEILFDLERKRKHVDNLERLLQVMQKVMTCCDSPRLGARDFHAQANLLLASLLGRRESFFKKMEEFYDRSGQA